MSTELAIVMAVIAGCILVAGRSLLNTLSGRKASCGCERTDARCNAAPCCGDVPLGRSEESRRSTSDDDAG